MKQKLRVWFLISLTFVPISAVSLRAEAALGSINTSVAQLESG